LIIRQDSLATVGLVRSLAEPNTRHPHHRFDRLHTGEPAENLCIGLSRGMSAEQPSNQGRTINSAGGTTCALLDREQRERDRVPLVGRPQVVLGAALALGEFNDHPEKPDDVRRAACVRGFIGSGTELARDWRSIDGS